MSGKPPLGREVSVMVVSESDQRRQPDEIRYSSIARRIGMRLRDIYADPEAEPLPTEHVNLLLELRHRERNRARSRRG
jgi:hypothetical protein